MNELGIVFFGTAAGFALAGLLASAYRLVAGEPLEFALKAGDPGAAFLGILLRTAAGPVLLLRWALGQVQSGRPEAALCLGAVTLACMWGFLSGVIVIETMAGFTSGSGTNAASAIATSIQLGR